MKVKIAEKVKNKRMARALREKKSSDKKAIQLQDKGNNNMQTPTKETDINEKLIEKLSEPAKKDKYDLIKERSARTTKQAQPKENSPKKSPIRPPGHQKVAMPLKGSSSLPQDIGQQIKKMPVEDQVVVTTASQKETEQEAADKQQALEALLHISGVELDSFTQDKKETILAELEQKPVDQCLAPADDHSDVVFSKSNSPGQEKNVSESSNVVRIDETEIGVKYQLKSDSLEEQGLKLTYTAPNAADYDLNPVSYGVYRPNRSKHVIPVGKQDSECSEFDKDKGKRIGKHVCEFCGRRCLKPSVLKKHIRSHTGERPYPCIPCGFSFKTKSNLYKHRKSHAHAIKAGLTPNLEGIKVIEDDENDSEETESEDEMEIDEGVDTINEKEMEERLTEGRPYENPTRVVEEIPSFVKFSKSGIPGQTSMFSGDAPHTPTSIERNPHQLVQEFPMVNMLPSEVQVIQDSNHIQSQGKSIPLTELMSMNSMNEYHGLSTKPTISSSSLSPIVNKDSENVSSEEKVSAQGEAGCGQVLENLRSKDVAGFRIDMETGRAMPILHTQLSASEQVDGVSEDSEKKMDVKIGKNDVDPAKLMIPLTNFSIVKSGGQFHVQIPVQGILESTIGKESENLLPKIKKSKDSEPLQQAVGQEKLESADIQRKVKRTRAVSENLISDSIEISKSHMQTLPVGGLLKASQSNRTSTSPGSHISSEAYQRFAGNIQHSQRSRSLSESIMLKQNTSALHFHSRSSQGLLTTTTPPQFSQVSVASSQPAHLGSIPGNILDGNKMRRSQPQTHVVSPRKISTSSSAIRYSQSITETLNSGFSSAVPAKDLDHSTPHSSTKKLPYRLYPAVSLPHASPSSMIPASAADKPTFLSKSVIPVQSSQTQQHSANSPNYSRYQTLEETQAALRAAQPKLFKRRKYKSEGDTIPSDIHLPKKRGRKPKHERIATERVPTPTRPMAPLPFLPTLPPVPQSPLIVSTGSASGRIPMLSSLHFTNFHSVNSESVRHSINSPLGSVIHPTNLLSTTNTESSRNANHGGTAPQFSGVSTNVYSNATASMFSGTTPLSSVHSVPYPDRSSTIFSTSVSVRTHDVPSRGQNSNLAQVVKEAKNRPSLSEVSAYHQPDTQIQAPFPGPSSAWTKRHRGISPKTQEYERPRPLMPMPDLVQIPVGETDDKKTRIKIESSVASDLKQTLVRPGLLKISDSLSPLRPNLGSRPSRKNLTLDIPSFGSLKHPAVTHAGKCTTPIEYAAKTLLSPEAFSIAQSVVKLASPMKNKPDGTPTTPVEAARELGRLAAHAAFANAGGKVENILSPMIPSMATSQGSIVVGPITTPTTSGPQKQYFVLPSPSKSHNPGFPSQSDNSILKKQKPTITTAESFSSAATHTVQTPPKPSPVFPPIPAPSQVMSPKVRSQAPSSSIIQQTEFTPVLNKSFQNRSKSTSGQTIAFIHGLPTYQAKSRHRTSALDKIDETVITNEGYKTIPTLLKCLYKNANGNHNITTPMFTCLHRTQPMYVKQHSNYKVSMYSNWRSGSTSLHPLGMSWKAHLGLNDSSRNRRPRMVYIVSPLSKDQDGILTHSSMWRREDQCTSASQQNIPSLKQQQHNDSPSRGEVNANFPHKLFRHGRIHHRRTESESAVIDSKSKERKMKDIGKHEPLRVPIFEGGFKSNEEYVYVRGRGRGKYVCEECGIRCKKPSMLKKHIRTHTDMRPYKCSICNFAFKTKGNLTKHMKSKAHNKKTVSTGGDDDDLGNLDDDDDRIEEEDYDNDHQFSDADENEDTDSAEGETSDEDEEDDDADSRCHHHSFLRRKRSHGSLPDISGFAGSSSDYHFSSILAGSLPSLNATRTDQSLSDSSDGVPTRRTLKRSHSESLDKIRREKSEKDVLSDPLKTRHYPMTSQNYLPGEAGKTEERKPTRSEVVGKLTQHLTNKNLEKLRAQTQSHPLVTTPSSHSGSSKSFDINQLPLPQMGPGILPLPTFQPTYGLSIMNISTGLAGSRSQEHLPSVPMGSNYRISAKIHEVTKPDNLNTVSLSKSEGTQDSTNESVHLAVHKNSAQKTITDVAVADSNAFKTHTTTALQSLPVTESNVRGFDPGLVGSVFIPVSSVLQGGLIPPTTAPYSSGQFIFTFPMPSPAATKESDVLLTVQHPKINQDVLRSSPQMHSSKISEHSPLQKMDLSSQNMEAKSHGFHTMPSSVTFTKRKRIQDSESISAVLTPPEKTTNESLENIRSVDNAKRIKYINTDVNHALQQPMNMNRIVMPKSLHHQMVHAPQAQFIPPPVAPTEVSLISHHSPKFTFSHGSSMSQVPLVSPITPSRMSQLPPTILSTPDINTSVIQQSYGSSGKTTIPPSSLSTEVTKSSDAIHKRIIEVENSDIEGIPSPTATRGGFHKCNVCLQGFTKPSQLRIHMRTHSDEHPYSCEECSLSFRTRGLLQKHERSPIHFSHVEAVELSTENADDPRPFKCKECSIAFRIPGHLAKHLRSKGHIMALERQGKLTRHRHELGDIDGSPTKDDGFGDHEDENTDSASEGEAEKVVVEEVKQVEYVHQMDNSD
ncbi:uncharacterized protein LOC117103251 isoform X2 [Anneissia japonica]|nr:uncharacterized protein LOC117103251 isoform X2 [Anneissia japonica]XP_033099705.1 uncharacterized protein LOC117103251 isoform X2 [Anneissia japonica]XP_033099706.1 uncharacterized protein LOC117103251 isoform X2 [Anneissia japonica]